MKNSPQILSVSLATGTAGAAVSAFTNSVFVGSLPVDVILGTGTSLALLGFASLLPSLLASRIDPLVALRTD